MIKIDIYLYHKLDQKSKRFLEYETYFTPMADVQMIFLMKKQIQSNSVNKFRSKINLHSNYS